MKRNTLLTGFQASPEEEQMIAYIKEHSDAKTKSQILRRGLYELYHSTRRKSKQAETAPGISS